MRNKIIALALACVLLIVLALPASAALVPQEERLPFIIVNGMGESPLLSADGSPLAWPPAGGDIAIAALKIIAMLPLLAIDGGLYGDLAYPILRELFDAVAYLPDGTSKHDVGQLKFPDSYAEDKTGMIDTISHGQMARLYGMDLTYQYVEDWRKSGFEEADGLNEMIERLKKEHGVDKVNIMAVSMGGATALGYLAKYGHGSVNNIVFMHTVFQGMYIVGDLFNGRLSFDSETLRGWLAQSLEGSDPWAGIVDWLLGALDDAGALQSVLDWAGGLTDAMQPRIYDEFLVPALCQFPGFWGCIPGDEDFESAKALLLDPELHAELIKQIDDYHYNAFNKAPELFKKAMADGRNVYVLSGHDLAGAPVGPRGNAQTDDGLTTACTSGGATCAPLGQTLGDNYKQAVACGHIHVSPDNTVDASTCMLPEQTWFQKDMHHTNFYDEESSQFLLWLLATNERLSVRSNALYPQFLQLKDGRLLALGGGEPALGIWYVETGDSPSIFPETGDGMWALLLLPLMLCAGAVCVGARRKAEG